MTISGFIDSDYQRVSLYKTKGGKSHNQFIHRLVLEAFVGECPIDMEGCHNDGNPTNNYLDNLRWDTHKNNIIDQMNHGNIQHGETHPKAILSEIDVIYIKERLAEKKHGMGRFLARMFNIDDSTISSIKLNRTWSRV